MVIIIRYYILLVATIIYHHNNYMKPKCQSPLKGHPNKLLLHCKSCYLQSNIMGDNNTSRFGGYAFRKTHKQLREVKYPTIVRLRGSEPLMSA